MKRILITGGKGMLGRTLQKKFSNYILFLYDLPQYDILNLSMLQNVFNKFKPDICIHCAAMTNVDKCETEISDAEKINIIGSKNVAYICKETNTRLIAISTDYVFSGEIHKNDSYFETDFANGMTVYGKTKRQGEKEILSILPSATILRVAWLYGNSGPSFVHTMLKLGKSEDIKEIKVVNDQFGNPTSTTVVANIIDYIISNSSIIGIIHGTCEGTTTWFEFTKEIFKLANIDKKIIPCTTEEFPRPAKRPFNSSLHKHRLYNLGYVVPNWKIALKMFFENDLIYKN